MQYPKYLRASALLLLVLVAGSAGTPVLAMHSQTADSVKAETSPQVGLGSPAETEHGALRLKGTAAVSELKKDHKAQTAEQRQKKCQSRKQGLTTAFSHINTNAQKAQTRIDGILSKATAYAQANSISGQHLTTLLATAQTAKATSATSIASLQAATPSLDCSSASVATDVATFRAAAQQARDNLKAYRSAVKAVLQSLQGSSQ